MTNKQNCFEQVFNNYLKASYLNILSMIKDPNESLNIIYRAVERLLMLDYNLGNLLNSKERLSKHILNQIKIYLNSNQEKISKIDIKELDTTIPENLYIFNFNFYKMFNEVDNLILHNILLFKKDIKEIVALLNFDEDYILERYKSILRYARVYFKETIKSVFK